MFVQPKWCISMILTYPYCLQLIKNSKFTDCQQLGPSQFDLWYRGPKPHPLNREISLEQTGVPQDANMDISLTVYGVQPLLSSSVNAVPENLISTPITVAFSVSRLYLSSHVGSCIFWSGSFKGLYTERHSEANYAFIPAQYLLRGLPMPDSLLGNILTFRTNADM